jgi:antitoxin component of MazEF toxin-antitoxin module
MTKKLVKHGNSLALIIEKPILNLLKISEDSEIDVAIENGALVIRSALAISDSKKQEKELIEKIGRDIMKRYDDVFKKLAKT